MARRWVQPSRRKECGLSTEVQHGQGAPSAHGGGGALAALALAIGALGVVYGDIGTSPLYTIKECFSGHHGIVATRENILGILSLVGWSLTLTICRKYLGYILKADNGGEGGTFALLALVLNGSGAKGKLKYLVFAGLFGAASIGGEGIITPAISVLSAVEGVGVMPTNGGGVVATIVNFLQGHVVAVTILILLALFFIQPRGTGGIGKVFGPATAVWFLSLIACGLPWVFKHPELLLAINPYYAVQFFVNHGFHSIFVLGSVVLSITGGEALYADLGHFGRKPITIAWYGLVYPALLVCYFAQGSFLLDWSVTHPGIVPESSNAFHPFFMLVPEWWRPYEVVIATVATVVASQALISGVFSMGDQAQKLGYAPRMTVRHTNASAEGQIYIPVLNWGLMGACIALVLIFKSSSALAAAYGFAVTTAMSITSLLFYAVARKRWGWTGLKAGLMSASFLVLDVAFWSTNIPKIAAGAYIPIVMGLAVFAVMTTWEAGRKWLAAYMAENTLPLSAFTGDETFMDMPRVKGVAAFMTANAHGVPHVLTHHVKHNHSLHETVILLTVRTVRRPEVAVSERVHVEKLSHGFYRVIVTFGFMEEPNLMTALENLVLEEERLDPRTFSFYFGSERLLPGPDRSMSGLRKWLYRRLAASAPSAEDAFKVPTGQCVSYGVQIEF